MSSTAPEPVDRPAVHRVTRRFVDGQALTRERRLVEARPSARQLAVDRHNLGRTHEQPVTDAHLVDGYIDDFSRRLDPVCLLRHTVEQRPQFSLRPAGCRDLERFAAGQHEHDDEARPVLADDHGGDDRRHREYVEPELPGEKPAHHVRSLQHRDAQRIERYEPARARLETCQSESTRDDAHPDRESDERKALHG